MRPLILAITILLLGLNVHTSAQKRLEGFKEFNPKQTLEGLKDIGLVVKYGQVDGLPEMMQPTVLQLLQDRAKDLLRLGEVPLLHSTDEAKMAGKPRLVFTVTLTKQTDTLPSVHVESRLYQRVRLWRDSAKEMEVATWDVRSGRPKATNEVIIALFEQHVDWFVKAYRAMNPNPPRLERRIADPAAQLKDNANSLQGLNGIDAYVSLVNHVVNGRRNELLISDEHQRALSNMLPREAESKLKQSGIPLLSYTDSERTGWPFLRITITLNPPNYYAPAIEIRSELWQRVRTVRDSRRIYAVTWESLVSEGRPTTDEALLRLMNSQLDEFIKAYTAANPKLSSAQ